jgi:hypothetical protein
MDCASILISDTCYHCAIVYKMDDAALAKLNIKTLKRYLTSYNISTHGMLEKQGNI